MMLSDVDIKNALYQGEIFIEEFDECRLQPASYDILLGNDFLVFDVETTIILDPKEQISNKMNKISIADHEFFILQPKQFALAVSHDRIGINNTHACQLMGKSSLARLGLVIHTTAGFIDPGNNLNITLELVNSTNFPLKLYPKMKIGQVAFYKLSSPVNRPYGHPSLNSKYFGSNTVESSKMSLNF
jgi:dCTP deaminase